MDKFTAQAQSYAESVTPAMITDVAALNVPTNFWIVFEGAIRIAWMNGHIAARMEQLEEIKKTLCESATNALNAYKPDARGK